jgi:hypothetical protein
VNLEIECKDWLDRVDKQMSESDEQKRAIASLQQALARSEQANEALKTQCKQKDDAISTLQHSVDTKSRQLQVICKERDRLKTENTALAKASSLPRPRPSTPSSSISSPAGFSTPSKVKDRSPVSVIAMSPSSSSPQSPCRGVDPYSWLLDNRPLTSAAEKGAQKDVAQLLKKMLSPCL